MIPSRLSMGATAFVCGFVMTALPGLAAATDYRFELVGEPQLSNGEDIIQIRLVHVTDGKPVPDAVIVESTADMEPAGLPTVEAPMTALPAKGGVYRFEVDPVMVGPWALALTARVRGEPETIRGTVYADLLK